MKITSKVITPFRGTLVVQTKALFHTNIVTVDAIMGALDTENFKSDRIIKLLITTLDPFQLSHLCYHAPMLVNNREPSNVTVRLRHTDGSSFRSGTSSMVMFPEALYSANERQFIIILINFLLNDS